MRHLLPSKTLLLVIVGLSAAPVTLTAGEQLAQVVTIRITNSANCLVDDTRVPCANVVSYLRDVLKLSARTQFRILPDKDSPYEATARLMEQFQKSEYKLKMGYVSVAEEPGH